MKVEEILKEVLRSEELPTLPTVASQLISITSREDTTLSDIAELISKDISLSAKILKVSNSAFYSFPQQIGSIHQAVSILGTNAVRSLVLSFSFLSIKSGKKTSRFNFELFWQRSLALAVGAKLILEKAENSNTEEIFISGLLQNLGELIFARTFSEKYNEILEEVVDNQHDTILAEERIIGANHTYIGFEVAKHWGFPEGLLLPILHHHDPEQYDGNDLKIRQTTSAVYLSDILINILYSTTPEDYHSRFRTEAKRLLKLKPADIEAILEDIHNQVEMAGKYFGLKIKNTRSIQEILQEANIRLSLLNLDYDQMNKQLIQTKITLENLTKELEEKNRILDNLANIDGLTEVFNHRYFQNSLDEEISRSERNDSHLSLILTDIDNFKTFNDTYGHQTGDFVLKEFCKTIKKLLRNYDILARYGGEEFVIILPETDISEAYTVAEKLRTAIEETAFTDGKEDYFVTSSFGITSCRPAREDKFDKDDMINKADNALYTAKEKGRNQTCIYEAKKKWYSF
ncbi:MAG: GGDEF domain-containing protein [Desulfopila sp.]|jgi:diguanylate cyclase (GGDEF)-like protein|nr:GGDEF domain-containing protein [Desulfopila sp.]